MTCLGGRVSVRSPPSFFPKGYVFLLLMGLFVRLFGMRFFTLMIGVFVVGVGCGSSGGGRSPGLESVRELESLGATVQRDTYGRVIEINLTGKPVGNADLNTIARQSHLQKLWLTNTGVTDAGLPSLMPLKNLRIIGLARTGVTDAGLLYLANMKSLREVYLYPNKVTDSAVDELKAKLPGIRVIY